MINNATAERNEESKREQSRLLARVFGYMGIGLVITAVVSFLFAWLFSTLFQSPDIDTINNSAIAYIIIMIVSGVALIIDTFVMQAMMRKSHTAMWVSYIIYTVLMGVFMSSFLLFGFDFYTIGVAFGLTAAVFLIMFAIGYFSPVNINLFAYIALGLLFTVGSTFLFFFILTLVTGNTMIYYTWSIVYSLVICVVILLVCAWDGYRVKKAGSTGLVSDNYALYLAFSMYTDFIALFVRILYVIAMSKNKN